MQGLGKERRSSMGSQASCVLLLPDHRGKVDRQHRRKGRELEAGCRARWGPRPRLPGLCSARTHGWGSIFHVSAWCLGLRALLFPVCDRRKRLRGLGPSFVASSPWRRWGARAPCFPLPCASSQKMEQTDLASPGHHLARFH